jgi:hypothetical protein
MNPAIATNLHHLRTVLRQHKPKPPVALDKSPALYHGWLLPYLLEADIFLWQRWQHWYETALAREVVAPIPMIQWQKDEAGFKMLDRSLSAITKYGDWRGWNSWAAFDFFMDWLLFGFAHKGQPQLPEEKEEYRGASARLYQVFNLETLLAYPYDYFGDILAENHHGRHLGFFPTPMEVCQLMVQMNMGDDDARLKSVSDPCVGTGRMLLSASNYSYRLYGSDINPTVIKATLVNGYLYAPWLVRPFAFLETAQSPVADEDAANERKFEPIKQRRAKRMAGQPSLLLEV